MAKMCAQLLASGVVRALLPPLLLGVGMTLPVSVQAMQSASAASIAVGFLLALLGSLLALYGWTHTCYSLTCGLVGVCRCCEGRGKDGYGQYQVVGGQDSFVGFASSEEEDYDDNDKEDYYAKGERRQCTQVNPVVVGSAAGAATHKGGSGGGGAGSANLGDLDQWEGIASLAAEESRQSWLAMTLDDRSSPADADDNKGGDEQLPAFAAASDSVSWFTIASAFLALTCSNSAWTSGQLVFHQAFGLNAIGFMCLDQVYGSLFTLGVMAVGHRAMPASPSQKVTQGGHGARVGCASACSTNPSDGMRTLGQLLRTTIRNACSHEEHGSEGLWQVAASKILANLAILIYFYLSVRGDASTLIFEMALLKLVFGTLYTIMMALCVPSFLSISAEERAEILAPRAWLGRVVGVGTLVLSLIASEALR